MRALRRRWLVAVIAILLAVGLAAGGYFFYFRAASTEHVEARLPEKPEAPPDLAKFRDTFASGLAALQRGDGTDAAKHFSSFEFRGRAVEEYRLFHLSNAYELQNDSARQRATLASLWKRDPKCVCRDVAGSKLASLYAEKGDWLHAAAVARWSAERAGDPVASAKARWQAVESQFYRGDIAGALDSARGVAVKAPAAEEAGPSLAVVRSIEGAPEGGAVAMTPAERFDRGAALLRDGEPQDAYDELTALQPAAPASLQDAIQLNRGLALHRMRRFEDSSKLLEPLASGYFKYAIPAIQHAARNYRVLAASINPMVNKTIVEKKKVGTVKVRVGKGKKRRLVTKPKFANVKKTIQLVDLAKKTKKETYERLGTERLKDLLQIKETPPEVRLEALTTLIGVAQAKKQDAYLQDLVRQVVAIERFADPALQYFWDKAWAAYARGDLNAARPLFRFITDTYGSPNVKRQSLYWYARTMERAGQKGEAAAIYTQLAAAPYEDLYALHSEKRGARRATPKDNPLDKKREDWSSIAEKQMPPELELAYQLTALSDARGAQLEIQRNARRSNQQFADALLADLYNSRGQLDLLYRSLRRAFPQLATVEQDAVPPYFLRMYYPVKYEDAIKKNAAKNGLDPYLVMALILQESYFNPKARSRVGAMGLMQLMPATGKELGGRIYRLFSVTRLENPETNIEIGTIHLRILMRMFDNHTQLVVASYNAGQGNVLKWRKAAPSKPLDEFLESIPFPETRNYVKRVTLLRSSYSRMAQ